MKEDLELRIEELEDTISELKEALYAQQKFNEVCAISTEHLWELLFNDVFNQPVPDGENLRNYMNTY
tara:strand:- start:54 stop:254 length:201 start_codon:yes stop_codon:yes gene_type:complete